MSAELVEYLARRLVDEPDAVHVEEIQRDGDTILQLHVASDDVGKVIGRQGRIARALRTPDDDAALGAIKTEVETLCRKFPLYPERRS